MMYLFRLRGFGAFVALVFLNAFIDIGHKVVLQNTVFRMFEGQDRIVLGALLKDVPLSTIFRGVWLFVLALCVALVVVLEVQPLALWLPSFMR